jgi:UPF0042 nucleotide-binding protein
MRREPKERAKPVKKTPAKSKDVRGDKGERTSVSKMTSVASSGLAKPGAKELVIVTGISGSGKGSALKALEDLGYYAVDNLPLELLPNFALLVKNSGADSPDPLDHGLSQIDKAVIVVDVREGPTLELLPTILLKVKKTIHTSVVFLDATDAVLVRRFSETRRPHPLSRSEMVARSITSERQMLDEVRNLADFIIDTSGFNVHELRAYMQAKFGPQNGDGTLESQLLVSCLSFGFKNGVPLDADLVFDVRFLPNPHFVAEFRKLTGQNPLVAKYVRSFPQTEEFLTKVTDMLLFLLPHYIKEGKSYLTIAFGCTGGQHRSVMMAEEMAQRLGKAGFRVKAVHRDMPR